MKNIPFRCKLSICKTEAQHLHISNGYISVKLGAGKLVLRLLPTPAASHSAAKLGGGAKHLACEDQTHRMVGPCPDLPTVLFF